MRPNYYGSVKSHVHTASYLVFVQRILGNQLPAQVTRHQGVILVIVALLLAARHHLITLRTQVEVALALALVQFKGRRIDIPLAVLLIRGREGGREEFSQSSTCTL